MLSAFNLRDKQNTEAMLAVLKAAGMTTVDECLAVLGAMEEMVVADLVDGGHAAGDVCPSCREGVVKLRYRQGVQYLGCCRCHWSKMIGGE